jgi:hypothetical protein
VRPLAVLAIALLCLTAAGARAETSLEVQSWCGPIANGAVNAAGQIDFDETPTNQFCWGAFAAIQGLTRIVWQNGDRALKSCPPPEATRAQLIKVYLKFAGDHPELAHQPFEQVARLSISAAFPCDKP